MECFMDQQTYVSHSSTNICTPDVLKSGLKLGAVGAIGGLIFGHVMGTPLLLTAGVCAVGFVAFHALNSTLAFCQEKYDLKKSTVALILAAEFAVLGTALMVTGIASGILGSVSVAILGFATISVTISMLATAMFFKFNESKSLDSQTTKTTKTEESLSTELQTEESTQSKQIKQQIALDFQTWSVMVNLGNFKGENLTIFYGHKINNSRLIAPFSVEKTKEGLDKFIQDSIVQNIQNLIDPSYNDDSTIDIEVLIVGELETAESDQIVHYQTFRQSYVGNRGKGHPGFHDQELKDSFMTDYVTHFKLLEIPAEIWNEDGSFKA